MADDLVAFDQKSADRIAKAVKRLESMRVDAKRGPEGNSTKRNIAGPKGPFIRVKLTETMHHDKATVTPANRVRNYKDDVVAVDTSETIKIWPGWQKGIWFTGDVIEVAKYGKRWIPVARGRNYFEVTLAAELEPLASATVTIDGETIPIREGGLTNEPIESDKRVGIILAHQSSSDFDVEWRPIPLQAGSSGVRCGKTKVTFIPGEVCSVAVWVPDATGGLDHVLLDDNDEEVVVDVIDADILTANLLEDTPVLFAPVNGVLTLIAPVSVNLPWGCIYGRSAGGEFAAWQAVTIQTLADAINPADTEAMQEFTKGTRVWTLSDYTGSSIDLHGITQEAIGSDETGIVRVFGQGPVQISVTDANLVAFATPDASNPNLFKAGAAGKHRIRTIESGTGTKWGVIDVHQDRRHIPWGCVLAKSAGATYPAWQAVSISSLHAAIDSGSIFGMDQFTQGERIWSLADYTGSQQNLFAVTQEEIGPNKTGLVRIYGLTPCQVNVTNVNYRDYATPDPSAPSTFKAGTFGPCLIKTIEGGTGVKWAVIDVHSEKEAWVDGVLVSNIARGGTANVNIYINGATATGETVLFQDKVGMIPAAGLSSSPTQFVFGNYSFQTQKAILRGYRCGT